MSVPLPSRDWREWAERLVDYIKRTASHLVYKVSGITAKDDGILLWDRAGYPVISKNGEWRQIVLADGYASYSQSADITPVAANTAYPITFNTTAMQGGITLGGDNYTITFDESGVYMLAFSVQLLSSSASAKNAWFWPRYNGSDVAGSTIKVTLSANGETLVMSRTALFTVSAGDTISAYYAVDDTTLHLHAVTATAFAPSSPSVILNITRLRQ